MAGKKNIYIDFDCRVIFEGSEDGHGALIMTPYEISSEYSALIDMLAKECGIDARAIEIALVVNKYWHPDGKRLTALKKMWKEKGEELFFPAAISPDVEEIDSLRHDLLKLRKLSAVDMLNMLANQKWRMRRRPGSFMDD